MQINKLELDNFFSFTSVIFEFPHENGIYHIEGENLDTGGSNGAGKSSLFEGVYFALTGKTIRKTGEEGLVNNQASGKCRVCLSLTHDGNEYVIERCRRPSNLFLFKNGLDITDKSSKDTQEKINSIFKIDEKSLGVSLVYGQHNSSSFLSSSPEDKRKILNSYLNLEKLFQLRDSVVEIRRTDNAELKFLDKKLIELLTKKEEFNNLGLVEKPGHDYDAIVKKEQEIKQLINESTALSSKIQTSEASLKKRLSSNRDVCYVCHKPLTDETVIKTIDLEITELREEIDELKSNREYYDNKIRNFSIPISSKELKKQLLEYEKSLDLRSKIDSINNDITEVSARLVILKERLDLLNFWQLAFSEKGIIRLLVREILEKFQSVASNYLKSLTNNTYNIAFDDLLNETIFCNSEIVQYNSLSGGEKNKVDLSVLMTLQQLPILVGNSSTNVLLFDEVGGFLDEDGIQSIYILLQELSKDRVLFVITHNKTLKKLLQDYPTFIITKQGGVSTIERKQP